MSGIELGYSYELGSGWTKIRVLTRPRKRSGTVMTKADNEHSSCSAMSKLSDVCGQFPKAYHISKYVGTGTISNWNHKWKHIK